MQKYQRQLTGMTINNVTNLLTLKLYNDGQMCENK